MKPKKAILERLQRTSDSQESQRERRELEYPALLVDPNGRRTNHSVSVVETEVVVVLPRVFEWSLVPGPDTLQ